MRKLLPDLTDKTVLDLGCGYGNCVEFVKNGAAKAVGVDISEKILEVAKAKCTDEKISYLHMSMTDIELLGEKFDLDQSKSTAELQTNSAYSEYLNLIYQTADTGTDKEVQIEKAVDSTLAEIKGLSPIDWFWRILSFLSTLIKYVYSIFML